MTNSNQMCLVAVAVVVGWIRNFCANVFFHRSSLSRTSIGGGVVVVVVSFVEMWMKWHKVRSREAKKKKKLDFNISSRCGNEYSYHSSLTNRISIARMTSTCFDSNAIRICSPFQQRTHTHRNQRSIISPFIFILLQWWSSPLVVYIITLTPPLGEWVNHSSVLFGWFKEYDNKVCYCFAILSTTIHPTTAAARSGCRTKLLGFGFELRFSSVLSLSFILWVQNPLLWITLQIKFISSNTLYVTINKRHGWDWDRERTSEHATTMAMTTDDCMERIRERERES